MLLMWGRSDRHESNMTMEANRINIALGNWISPQKKHLDWYIQRINDKSRVIETKKKNLEALGQETTNIAFVVTESN